MKKAPVLERDDQTDDMLPEYDLDFSKARRNPFVGRIQPGSRVISLDPDVAAVFRSGEEVNRLLRAIISSMPANVTKE